MSKISRGEVALTLAGTAHTLKPTLACYQKLATQYENYGVLLNKIASGNVPAIMFVIRHGLGFNDQQAKKLSGLLMDTGISAVTDPLSDFVYRLFNGGKSVDEVIAAQTGAADADKAAETEEIDPLLAG